MTEASDITWSFRVESLPSLYRLIVRALIDSEITGPTLNELISNRLSAACVTCGITLKGDELSAVALARSTRDLPEDRLARLKQGYCCRRGCESYYYKVVFASHPAVDWEKILHKTETREARARIDAMDGEELTRSPMGPFRPTRVMWVMGGASVAIILFLVAYLIVGGHPSDGKGKPKYTVDPASVATVPGH